MTSYTRSINQRLARIKSPARKAEVAQGWAANWESDQTHVLRLLEQAHRRNNWHGAGAALAQLRAISEKRFFALPGVIAKLAEVPTPSESDGL